MALDSTTTPAQAYAQMNNNLRWHTDRTGAMANDFIEACRWLLGNRPDKQALNGRDVNYADLDKQCAKAEQFMGALAPRANGRARRNVASLPSQSGLE